MVSLFPFLYQTMNNPVKIPNTLYDQDFFLWLEETAQLLRNRQLEQIDYDNLIEEIEGMSRSEKNALESNLRILLMRLLKWSYQPDKRSNSWRYTIREHRKRLQKAFKKSPSLKPYFEEVFAECYQDGRELASDETGLSIHSFPENCPFSYEQVLDTDFLSVN